MITKQIQLFKPVFNKSQILSQISECLDISWTGLGFKTQEFEEKFKKFTSIPHAHFLNSATSGLHLALEIIKRKYNYLLTNVITSPLTFISASHTIKHAGLEPLFIDINDDLCMNNEQLRMILSKPNQILAVIYTGIGGNTGDLRSIVETCHYYNIPLILDASHMMGTHYRYKHIGNEGQDFTIFSFHAVKNLPTADGGMICCKYSNDDKLARKLSWLGINKDTYTRQNSEVGNWRYDVEDIGYKYHGNSIMAAMGIVGLGNLSWQNKIRQEQALEYNIKLDPHYIRIPINSICTSSRHLYQVRVISAYRDKIIDYARSGGIQLGVHYRSHKEYSMYRNCKYGTPIANMVSQELISLPIGPHLTWDDFNYIIGVLNEYKF
jgi:dTDP-4-amino-4,6-dideoxygalactose transaminase